MRRALNHATTVPGMLLSGVIGAEPRLRARTIRPRRPPAGELGVGPLASGIGPRRTGLPLCEQRGDYAADNLPTHEHPEVADVTNLYGLHLGVGRHRSEAGHDHVECGRECQPPHAVRRPARRRVGAIVANPPAAPGQSPRTAGGSPTANPRRVTPG